MALASANDAKVVDRPPSMDETHRSVVSLLKRSLDIIGALAGVIVIAPILLLTVILIRLESPGSVLFRQRRTGLNGKVFWIYKFRSMTVAEDGDIIVQAKRGDQRTTKVGAFIRRTSIDELPQLFNVLRGEMSLVGPRPHAVAHDEFYAKAIPDYRLRFRVRPGITGLAQVCGFRGETRDLAEMEARIEKDNEYIDTWSIWLDIKILVRTLLIFAFHPAAY
jgi:putative colanic acid biosysnthesis UDP-glucose lipid carrier transferase